MTISPTSLLTLYTHIQITVVMNPFNPIENQPTQLCQSHRLDPANRRLRDQIAQLQNYKRELLSQEASTCSLRDKVTDLRETCQKLTRERDELKRDVRIRANEDSGERQMHQKEVLDLLFKNEMQLAAQATRHNREKKILQERLAQTHSTICQLKEQLDKLSPSFSLEYQLPSAAITHSQRLEDDRPKPLMFSSIRNEEEGGHMGSCSMLQSGRSQWLGQSHEAQSRRGKSRGRYHF